MTAYSPWLSCRVLIAGAWMCLVAAGLARTEGETGNACSMPKAEFVLQYPASLIHSTAPAATGCSFQTPDGEFNVEAVVQPKTAEKVETVDDRMQKEIDLLAGTVTYKNKGE